MAHLHLDIITQEKHVFSQAVLQVTAPASSGEVTVLPGHIPLFTKLNDGVLVLKTDKGQQEFAVMGGFMDVSPGDKITILADAATLSDDVNIALAEEARKRAEDALKNKQSEVDFKQAEASLRKAMLELKVAHRSKRRTDISQ